MATRVYSPLHSLLHTLKEKLQMFEHYYFNYPSVSAHDNYILPFTPKLSCVIAFV